ncbi:MAG: alpha-E domain-containing protein [Peptococcaceae bacterium]
MGVISLEKSQHMYWLGRYIERVFTTLQAYSIYFDRMIEEGEVLYQQFCTALGIPDVYGSQQIFFENYLFDNKDPFSVSSSLNRAFDNGVVLRDEISSESLSYIHLAMERLEAARDSRERLVDLQQVQDYLYAFWGSVDDCADSELCRNLMKCGRYQERLDLYVRLHYAHPEVERTFCKLQKRIEKAGMPYHADQIVCVGNHIRTAEALEENRQIILCCLAQLFV